jgi:hypothetical protein
MRMTKKRRAEEAAAASSELAPTRKVTRAMLEGTVRSTTANAERLEEAGYPVAAARARAIAERAAQRLEEAA